ncbi:MAG: hypothetical protein QOE29_2010, partial [Gaiellaceae bacterium]|nr:hypothetical protein [Gaiellaceae bacterium]
RPLGWSLGSARSLEVRENVEMPGLEPTPMIARQTRIFVPPSSAYAHGAWAETLLGRIIAPLTREHPSLAWFWFSRYVQERDEDVGDCDISQIPTSFEFAGGNLCSVRFRYAIPEEDLLSFETRAQELIDASGARVSDFREYDWVGDLGGDRFVGEDRADARRETRAELVVAFCMAVSRLTLDCLRGPGRKGRYRLEENDSAQNPYGSSFESIHHLFCNMTDVPTFVLLGGDQPATHWMPSTAGGEPSEFRLRF